MNVKISERSIQNIVIGSGAAGFNTAARLHQFGKTDVALIAEDVMAGTSRNTGSDKQTYYKLSLAGGDRDCVLDLAEDLFAGQCVDGDQALCEAALSTLGFYHLVDLGVPFPCNAFGEYIGYKTDHDRGRRATSVGPYTSKVMTEKLEADVRARGIEVIDGLQVIRLLVTGGKIRGVLCLDRTETKRSGEAHFAVIRCENCVLATGGPAGMYRDSVYPASQIGSSGIAFEAGVKGKNLTEWQYGMASLAPRWNVSGTYMQVLPRVVSTAEDGSDEREFLLDFFGDRDRMLSLVFLKGYQWPFDTNKIFGGSSMIDLLVYQERCLKGRRVFLDYRTNSCGEEIEFEKLSAEAYEYLKNADACFGTPIERLAQMNQPAIDFYREHGVDLATEMLEIAICAQHNNGGLAADSWWMTDIDGLYTAGEVCGSHGVTRPGGTALNAGQVGSYRAAYHIANKKAGAAGASVSSVASLSSYSAVSSLSEAEESEIQTQIAQCIAYPSDCHGTVSISELWKKAQARMSKDAAMIRNPEGLESALAEASSDLASLTDVVKKPESGELAAFYHLRDMLLSQVAYIYAMLDYVKQGGGSRGSALYTDPSGEKPEGMPELYRCRLDNREHAGVTQEIRYADGKAQAEWREVRPIPQLDYFFEKQWKAFREGLI